MTDIVELLRAENSRLVNAIVLARQKLAKGRSLWNGPCHECDAVLQSALAQESVIDPASETAMEHIARDIREGRFPQRSLRKGTNHE